MYFVGNEPMNTPRGTLLNSEKNDHLESADILLSSILNLLSGKAVVSCEVNNNGSLECKIRCSANFPTLTVFYDKCDQNHENSMSSVEVSAPYPENIVSTVYDESRERNSHCSRTVKNIGSGDKELLLESGNDFHANNIENKIQENNKLHSDATPEATSSENSCKSNLSLSECTLDEQNDVISNDQNLLTCSYCGKIFLYKYHKISHERIHTGEKPYSCDYCDKTFTFRSSKVSHERSHTGEKPYYCRYCNKNFASSSNRISHERLHTDERLCYCRYCKCSFPMISLKVAHEKTCPRKLLYSCKYCRELFHSLTSKLAHEAYHSELINK